SAGRRFEFHVSVGGQADSGHQGLHETLPAAECHAWDREWPEFQGAVDVVYAELMLDEKVCDERLVGPPLRSAKRNADRLVAPGREHIEGLASSSCGPQKAPAQKPDTGERKQPRVCPGGRIEPCHKLRLLAVNHAHDRQFLKQPTIPQLKHKSS